MVLSKIFNIIKHESIIQRLINFLYNNDNNNGKIMQTYL